MSEEQDMYAETTITMQQATLSAERARLVRLCARLTGDAHAAEDLAQETLLVAWQQEHALHDPEKRAHWLSGIARNLCLHWRRRQGLERCHAVTPLFRDEDATTTRPEDDRFAAGVDLEADLERHELVDLLDRALALLPPDSREVLIARYVREASHAEVAARLALSEDAVKKRVERGKAAFRRVLSTDLHAEAAAYGLVAAPEDTWQETRIWCPGCGRQKLAGQFHPDAGELRLHCFGCSPHPLGHYINAQWGDGLRDLRTYKPAVSRVLTNIHELYRVLPVDGVVRCPSCGDPVPIRRGIPPQWLDEGDCPECIYRWCPRCDVWDLETWHALTWSLPAVRRFWQEHPRMRFLPEREIEVDGSPAMVAGFESVTSAARLDVVSLRDSLRVVRIVGAGSRNPVL